MTTLPGPDGVARVVALRCFPVKAAGGQALPALDVGADGVVGDRAWAV